MLALEGIFRCGCTRLTRNALNLFQKQQTKVTWVAQMGSHDSNDAEITVHPSPTAPLSIPGHFRP